MVKKVIFALFMICFTLAFLVYSIFLATKSIIETREMITLVVLGAGAMIFAWLHVTNMNKE